MLNRLTVITLSISLLCISIIPYSLSAQSLGGVELDELFLEGLDPSLRDQLESTNEDIDKAEIDNLFRSETSIEKNKIILKKLRTQLDALATRMKNPDASNQNERLSRFGESFFSSIQSSFMPINIPNLDSNYIVDVGDKFTLLLTGKLNKELELEVQRDGSLVIPQVGKVQIAGKSLQEAEKKLSNYMSSVALGVTHYLTLSEIRDVQILMVGGVEQPGIYTISGGSSILHALNVAGGISRNGSFRRVDLLRNGELVQTFDLYDIFVNGTFQSNKSLRSGDSILVHSIGHQIPISGGIINEGIYEILPSETLADLVSFAGGFSEGFDGFKALMVKRVNLDLNKTIMVPIEELDQFGLNIRDSILVPSFLSLTEPILEVTLEGSVHKPGIYYLSKGEKLSDIIQRAGGYLDEAYIYGSALFRKDALQKEQLYSMVNYKDTINYLVGMMGRPGAAVDKGAVELMLEELKSENFTGRIVTDFNLNKLTNDPGKDIELQDQDRIVIPAIQKTVYLFGEFKTPVNVLYRPDYSVKDYIQFAGGLERNAIKTLVIIDPDGKVNSYNPGNNFFSKDIPIYPGSIIYAQRDVGKLEGIYFAGTLAPILSSLALSLASLNSISNN